MSPVILFGGASSERLVSVASAQNVSALLPDARCWFLSPDGPVFVTPRDTLAAHRDVFMKAFEPGVAATWPSLDAALDAPEARGATFLLALHGGDGENGVTQRRLEARGLAFTGSGSEASATAFDKVRTLKLAAAKGAKVAASRLLEVGDEAQLTQALTALLDTAPRWVLKPRADGSSHGLFHLRSPADVADAAKALARVRLPYLAEVFIAGRELTVGVVNGDDGATALPVSEVRLLNDGAFDYEGKYLGRNAEELTPAPISDDERRAAQALALLTHAAVGCFGYSRTDMILAADGLYLLEINTLPGLTRASFIPQQLAAAGLDPRTFLLGQLQRAQRRDRSSP